MTLPCKDTACSGTLEPEQEINLDTKEAEDYIDARRVIWYPVHLWRCLVCRQVHLTYVQGD